MLILRMAFADALWLDISDPSVFLKDRQRLDIVYFFSGLCFLVFREGGEGEHLGFTTVSSCLISFGYGCGVF